MRTAIEPGECLCICLRYLVTGDCYKTIAFSFRVGVTTVSNIIGEVCQAIWDCLMEEFMPVPTKQDWSAIAEGFLQRWNFPNCLGSIDGKHVVIQAPPRSGSKYRNYKNAFSIVLLAVVDAEYLFRMVDVGAYGRNSDGGTLNNCPFGEDLKDGKLDLPGDCVITGAEHLGKLPHVFVGDEAFPLRRNLLRPFPGTHLSRERRVFNYRFSRARLTVECAFGILASRWRMYRRSITLSPERAELCVKATCILHNFIRVTARHTGARPVVMEEGEDELVLQDLTQLGTNNAARAAIRVRETFAGYFSAEGAVPWQGDV